MRFSKFIWIVPSFAVAMSCGKKKSDEETTTNADGSTKLESLSNPAQLGVSKALNFALPGAYDNKATSLALAPGKKSQEACQMGEPVRSVKQSLDEIKSFFCHIEIEKEKIKFGVKTKITSNGEEFGRIWIDNSKAADGKITLYMCESGALKEKIDITGVKMGADGVPSGMKGSVQHKGGEGTQTWASSVTFDKNFTGAYIQVSSQDKFTDSSSNGSFARSVELKLQDSESEVSKISLASSGTWGGQTFAQKGVGLGASKFGQALFVNSGTHDSQSFSWTHRSFFDSDGYVVEQSASTLLGAEGSLYVKSTDLPEYLSASFSPDAPSGWDCSGADTVVDLNPETEAHNACNSDHEKSEVNCWGADFDDGVDAN